MFLQIIPNIKIQSPLALYSLRDVSCLARVIVFFRTAAIRWQAGQVSENQNVKSF